MIESQKQKIQIAHLRRQRPISVTTPNADQHLLTPTNTEAKMIVFISFFFF
jgi:hypothetical protein